MNASTTKATANTGEILRKAELFLPKKNSRTRLIQSRKKLVSMRDFDEVRV